MKVLVHSAVERQLREIGNRHFGRGTVRQERTRARIQEVFALRGGPALAAGAADIAGVASPGAAIAIQKGVKQKIVALAGPNAPRGWYLIVPSDTPIKTTKDLNGKKVGITGKGSSTDFFSLLSAKNGGATIQSIPLGAGILPALKAKQIDAGVIWPLSIGNSSSRDGMATDRASWGRHRLCDSVRTRLQTQFAYVPPRGRPTQP